MGDTIRISTDELVFWQWGFVKLNATLVFTWFVMFLLVGGSWLVTRRLTSETQPSRWQSLLEVIIETMRKQIREVSRQDPGIYLPFVGTLFLYIATANLLLIVPRFKPPTASLSTTAALAACVFVAVPLFGIGRRGLLGYLKQYVQPTPLMLPFNIIGELSRTLALAVRLYGNMMSGTVIAAILIGFVPLFVPILMDLLGLLTGMIQAYIFAVLAMVYIASATRARQITEEKAGEGEQKSGEGEQKSDEGEQKAGGGEQKAGEGQQKAGGGEQSGDVEGQSGDGEGPAASGESSERGDDQHG